MKGFTIIELMIVLASIGVLMSVMVPLYLEHQTPIPTATSTAIEVENKKTYGGTEAWD